MSALVPTRTLRAERAAAPEPARTPLGGRSTYSSSGGLT
jgi:hypothetical protein